MFICFCSTDASQCKCCVTINRPTSGDLLRCSILTFTIFYNPNVQWKHLSHSCMFLYVYVFNFVPYVCQCFLLPYYFECLDSYICDVFSPVKHTADLFALASVESRPLALDTQLPSFPPWCGFCLHFCQCFHDGLFCTVIGARWHKMHHNECLWDGAGHCPHHLPGNPSGIKTCVKHIPMPFLETWQPCSKGPSGSLILGLFWAPHHSTSIKVFELFFHCAMAFQYVYWKVYLFSTSRTPDHEAACNVQVAVGKILNLPVRQVEPAQKK